MKINKDGTCSLGCDISYWQGDVNFDKMKKAGIQAVIIRAGHGTSVDKRFLIYIKDAIAAGLKIGVYWFIYAKNTAESRENAAKCISTIAPYKDHIQLGVWADWEYDSDKRAGSLNKETRSELVDTFCNKIAEGGYEPGIYSNQDYIKTGKFTADLILKYPLWFARYASSAGSYADKGKDGNPYIWQYSSSGNGKTYGVSSSAIDLDMIYISIDDMPSAPVPSVEQEAVPVMLGGLDYGPVFDPNYYVNKYPDLLAAFGHDTAKLFEHWRTFGIREGRQAHPGFSVTKYRDLYPDLQAAYGSDLMGYVTHYLRFGREEGRKGI